MKKDRQEVPSACQPYCLYIQPDAHKKNGHRTKSRQNLLKAFYKFTPSTEGADVRSFSVPLYATGTEQIVAIALALNVPSVIYTLEFWRKQLNNPRWIDDGFSPFAFHYNVDIHICPVL